MPEGDRRDAFEIRRSEGTPGTKDFIAKTPGQRKSVLFWQLLLSGDEERHDEDQPTLESTTTSAALIDPPVILCHQSLTH